MTCKTVTSWNCTAGDKKETQWSNKNHLNYTALQFWPYFKNKHTPLTSIIYLSIHYLSIHHLSTSSDYSIYLLLEYMLRLVSDSTLDADGTVDIGLTVRPPPVATPPKEHRKPDMLVHSVMMCCRSSSVISGMCGRDDSVLELLPILRLRICEKYPSG